MTTIFTTHVMFEVSCVTSCGKKRLFSLIYSQIDRFWPFPSLSYEPLYSVICQSNDHIIVRGFMGHPSVNTMHLEWRQMVQQNEIYAKNCPAELFTHTLN